jgi:phosphopantetheine adenylyltransferase
MEQPLNSYFNLYQVILSGMFDHLYIGHDHSMTTAIQLQFVR